MSPSRTSSDPTSPDFDVTSLDRSTERALVRLCAAAGAVLALASIAVTDAHGVATAVAVVAGLVLALAFVAVAVRPSRQAWYALGVLVLLSWWPCFAWSAYWIFPALLTLLYLLFVVVIWRIRRLP